ncbi:hypothetical protein EJ03DRAFT_324221 [Teratosphaeria nubilosa]|uniref:Uncharacterized protein n=1 Tax=Teratosphaeria nubilosa TaxID=161662 RepID=A0A6G1LJR3_9PEZI|nr:hypothetical protein EJ03DRAFT_324221 [Teratosphaeria nubilosa]
MTAITSLPKDVLALIVSYVKLKSHLWSAAKSCKSLYAVVIPTFYRHLVIKEGDNMLGLVAALNPGNAGLQHVRHLTFLPRCEHFRKSPVHELDWIFSMLTNMLPRDRLLTFTFDCFARIYPKLLAVLYQRQRHLRTMRVSRGFFPSQDL